MNWSLCLWTAHLIAKMVIRSLNCSLDHGCRSCTMSGGVQLAGVHFSLKFINGWWCWVRRGVEQWSWWLTKAFRVDAPGWIRSRACASRLQTHIVLLAPPATPPHPHCAWMGRPWDHENPSTPPISSSLHQPLPNPPSWDESHRQSTKEILLTPNHKKVEEREKVGGSERNK